MFYQTKVLEDKPISYFEGASSGYLALINNTQRDISTWTLSGCSAVAAGSSLQESAPTSSPVTTKVTNTTPGTPFSMTSPALGKMKDLHAGVGLTASFHVRASIKTQYVEIVLQRRLASGLTPSSSLLPSESLYATDDWTNIGTAQISVPQLVVPSWIFFSHTFRTDVFASAMVNEDFRIVIKINDLGGGLADDYVYFINGLSVGQKSETVASSDMGSNNAYSIASIGGGPTTLDVGVYNGLLTAVKSGIPLHRSITSSTLLEPYLPERPSLTLKNSGFMQEANKVDTVTLEFWMKVGSVPNTPVRLVGPVGERTGLYLDGTTLTLSIGNIEVGYDIGTIDYPMLIDWVVSPSYSAVLLNGETIINSLNGVDVLSYLSSGDIGFFTDPQVHPVYISSIATYQYAVSSTVAKIRFVRGQGTDQYGIIADRYDGKSYSADFATSDFATNLTYPDNARWHRGISNNVVASDKITLPEYDMPELTRQSTQDWAALNLAMFSRPSPTAGYRSGYKSDIFPLDVAADNTSGTGFTNTPVMGEVYTTQTLASSRTNLITIPGGWKSGVTITISGEAKFAGNQPELIVTFNGPNTTYTTAFPATQPKSVATLTQAIPFNTTSITWGVRSTGGMTSGQFHNVYAKITYPRQPFYLKPTGYTAEPYLSWRSLNFLHEERTSAVVVRMKTEASPGSPVDLLTLRKKDTQTLLRAYLNGTTLTYEYSDYTGTTVLGTRTVGSSTHFSVGFDLDALATKYPNMSVLLGSPANIEVLVGGGTTNTFTGGIYFVSFYNAWHRKNSSQTYTNGLADIMVGTSAPALDPATYSLIAVTEYGNFTLDVAASGYWQETLPVSLFTKEVTNVVGESEQRVDFIQATVGKTRATPPFIANVPMTYFQLLSKYWGESYSDLATDNSTYTNLNALTSPTYDPTQLDLQTWVALHKLTDQPVDYTQKTAMSYDGTSTVYLDNNGYRQFVQDGFSLVIPYTFNHRDYALTFYHLLSSRGQRSSPVKLKSFELASWASGAAEWSAVGTQEGNDAYPYLHNGSYYVMDFPSVFEITKRGYNYLYKSNRSGFKPKGLIMPGYDTGMAFGWKRSSTTAELRSVAAVSMWIMLDSTSLSQTTKVMTVTRGANQECYVDAVPIEGGTRFALQAKTGTGAYINAQWFVNGNLTASPILRAGEWNAVQLAFVVPFDSNGEQVYVRVSGNTDFAFDHVTIHGQMKANIKGTAVYRRWDDVMNFTSPNNQWGSIAGSYTWYTLYDLGAVLNVDVMFDEMVGELTGTNTVGQFTSSLSTAFGEVYVLRDVEWVDVPVISK